MPPPPCISAPAVGFREEQLEFAVLVVFQQVYDLAGEYRCLDQFHFPDYPPMADRPSTR